MSSRQQISAVRAALLRLCLVSYAARAAGLGSAENSMAGLQHFESCEQCVAAGLVRTIPSQAECVVCPRARVSSDPAGCRVQGWSPHSCRCGGFANRACSGTASDCRPASSGPARPFYAARFPKAYQHHVGGAASSSDAAQVQLAGTISCADNRRSGDTSDFRSGAVQQLGHDAPDMLYRFVVNKTCTVTVDLCDSEFDSAVRVLSSDGLVEYARNDDDVSCCDKRHDKELRSAVRPYARMLLLPSSNQLLARSLVSDADTNTDVCAGQHALPVFKDPQP